MKFKVGLAQIAPALADVRGNLVKHLAFVERAVADQVDLLIFPELSLTGYSLQDLTPTVAIGDDDPVLKDLLEASRQIDLVASFIHEDDRHRRYVAADYMSQGKLVHRHHKVYLPTYGMFDEAHYWGSGNAIRAFDTRFGRMGIGICEDLWHVSLPYVLWADGADIMLFISNEPGRGVRGNEELYSSNMTVQGILRCYAGRFTTHVIHCNRTGFENGVLFGGASVVFGPDGSTLAEAGQFEEELLTVEIDTDDTRRERISSPVLRDEKFGLTLNELSRIFGTGGRDK